VIHAAGTRALAAGANLAWVLEVARALAPSIPVVPMCYANMVFAPGADAFVDRLARTGACGLIVPDLPLEESGEVREACDAHGLALVPLVAPTTTPARLAAIGASARGFLYTVSVVGTTGERESLQMSFAEVIARAKASTSVPVALGFGISTPEQARQAADAGADGVIVGTRLVRAAGEDLATPVRGVEGAATTASTPREGAWPGAQDAAAAVGAVVGELAAGLALAR
jgi:tryptophan synthase alpha chain